ncbi:hypothetical protein BGW39_005449 [Mortierella sp. 14UC]|nr:hypothetical protein BGW39_005449 [Mortierella sp. 14UC]
MMKSKALSMKNIARVPSSTKDKRISIEVHADSFTIFKGRPMPVFFSNLETPAIVSATVTFETDQDCQGQDVEINFRAYACFEVMIMTSFHSKLKQPHNMQRKRWTMPDLVRPSQGTIAAGKYTRTVSATIDPLWPSSGITKENIKGNGWVSYTFEARFMKNTMGGVIPVLTTPPFEFWVVNSILPACEATAIPKPLTFLAPGKKPDLPVSLTIPNTTLQFRQQVPLTVHVEPFRKGCKRFGQNITVLSAGFSIREKVIGWTKQTAGVDSEISNDVVQLAFREGWPQNQGGWSRTVNITLPTTPEINASMASKTMDIRHSVLFTMKYKAENDKDSKAQEVTVEAPFQLAVPRRNLEAPTSDDFLPTYSAADAEAFERRLDGNGINEKGALPNYAREE